MPDPRRKSAARLKLFDRDAYRCVYCGEQFLADDLTIDHVEPRMRGGDRSAGNLVTCCRACNAAKGGQAAWAFLADRPGFRENFFRYATHVWPRLRRAIEEAAERSTNPTRSPKL